MFLLYQLTSHLAYYNLFSPKKQLYVFIFSQTCFLLLIIFKEKIAHYSYWSNSFDCFFFFPLFTPESLLYYSFILFYLTLSIIYFTSFYYYKFKFFFLFLLSLLYFQLSKSLTWLLWSLPVPLFPFYLPIILLIILPSNPSSSYTYPNSILRLT